MQTGLRKHPGSLQIWIRPHLVNEHFQLKVVRHFRNRIDFLDPKLHTHCDSALLSTVLFLTLFHQLSLTWQLMLTVVPLPYQSVHELCLIQTLWFQFLNIHCMRISEKEYEQNEHFECRGAQSERGIEQSRHFFLPFSPFSTSILIENGATRKEGNCFFRLSMGKFSRSNEFRFPLKPDRTSIDIREDGPRCFGRCTCSRYITLPCFLGTPQKPILDIFFFVTL